MIKREERLNPRSCFNRAMDDEMLFVLLGRDPAAPATIRFWCRERVRLGKNTSGDPQIQAAEAIASELEALQLAYRVLRDARAAISTVCAPEQLRDIQQRVPELFGFGPIQHVDAGGKESASAA